MQQVPHRAHWQPLEYNALHGGMQRWFEPMEPATVARPYTHELIREYATNCNVISLGSSELVQLAEQKLRGETLDTTAINAIVTELLSARHADSMDTLVLACTHFPLLREELAKALPAHINMIDSGEAIARRVDFLLTGPSKVIPKSEAPTTPLNVHLSLRPSFKLKSKTELMVLPRLAGKAPE